MSDAADRSALADRVHAAAIRLLRLLRKQDVAMGVTPARASALSVVVFAGPVTLGQLADAEQVSAPTMTRLVVGLESDGLVVRERDAQDARVMWVRATAKGARILREGRRRRVAQLTQELERLSNAEISQLERGTEILERVTSHHPSLGAMARSAASPARPRDAAHAAARGRGPRRKR